MSKLNKHHHIAMFFFLCLLGVLSPISAETWISDNGNGTYSNPLFYEEFSDPSMIRVGDDFYLTGDEHPQWDDPSGLGSYYTLTGPVPEPSTLMLMLAGFPAAAALVGLRRRRQPGDA